jgi:hypothetical protein
MSHESLDSSLFRPVANNREVHARQASRSGVHLPEHRHEVREADGRFGRGGRRLCPLDAGNSGDKRALQLGGHRQGAGMARARQRLHDAALRPAQDAAGGQSDISCEVLKTVIIALQTASGIPMEE